MNQINRNKLREVYIKYLKLNASFCIISSKMNKLLLEKDLVCNRNANQELNQFRQLLYNTELEIGFAQEELRLYYDDRLNVKRFQGSIRQEFLGILEKTDKDSINYFKIKWIIDKLDDKMVKNKDYLLKSYRIVKEEQKYEANGTFWKVSI